MCRLSAQAATVFYWPPATATRDLCARNPLVTPPPAVNTGRPSTAVLRNMTITSPTALVIARSLKVSYLPISLEKQDPAIARLPIEERWPYMRACGQHLDATWKLEPQKLSTLRSSFVPTLIIPGRGSISPITSYSTTSTPYPFDFADLIPGYAPWDAVAGSKGCNTLLTTKSMAQEEYYCPTTLWPAYTPVLQVPKSATTVDPDYEICEPQRVETATYVPITATTLAMPAKTNIGARVSVLPKSSRLTPKAILRILEAGETAGPSLTTEVIPGPEISG